MELHDLYLATEKYQKLQEAIHEGYQLDKDELEYMRLLEDDWGLEETPEDINEEEVYDEEE